MDHEVSPPTMNGPSSALEALDERLRQRQYQQSLPMETLPELSVRQPRGSLPNTPLTAAIISFTLGSTFTVGFVIFLLGGLDQFWWATYQFGFFVSSWAAFHWAEFAVTAGWNREKCSVDSFLLNNGNMYHIANGLAFFEYLLTLYFNPSLKTHSYVSQIGILFVWTGQALRSTAMIQASTNFSHAVAFRKLPNHTLVTGGIYAWLRHPSYTGFIYWALGTQLVLQNPLTCIVYVALLWKFFSERIREEERLLIKFFGDAYVDYRKRVGTLIPFIP